VPPVTDPLYSLALKLAKGCGGQDGILKLGALKVGSVKLGRESKGKEGCVRMRIHLLTGGMGSGRCMWVYLAAAADAKKL
jgi:hypothetical protein